VAHDFWTPNYALLQSERGIEVIVRHCNVLERHFDHLGQGIIYEARLDPSLYLAMISDPEHVETAIAGFTELLIVAEEAIAALPPWPKAGAKSGVIAEIGPLCRRNAEGQAPSVSAALR
jgi:hypothetical protein